MAKEIERAGIPVCVMCNLIDVAKTVGSNRMVQTVSVPYPLGDPGLSKEAEWKLRTSRVEAALDSLTVALDGPKVFPSKF
ncbi:selenoprotein B, glycine/betaine/sarcosine/D-proline reductase family [Jonquetella anthropi DSM 22815]|uniref:Selenoprotein B, glycine/betaine/sarcosine/D-proline reductase family n=3 Tax=Jonquetella TaxID=428711 RepID=H0UME8_9BACT|nr:selenoprotein B, glycine/betaine/sarcosine/D-proline reductase domain protein [Jonquetella anthropi E3_33 E1]EHM12621.1 selenoprotein B, glycine/betaine/sarcosine/D-proline reductase family [Jonquetella anthropi DSM 22815]